MDGFINLNKAAGLSSHSAMAAVRRLFHVKAGHAGTLDPGAEGVLPICLGKATRLSQYLMDCRKCYRGRIVLGITTDSYDDQGLVLDKISASHITKEDVLQVLPQFQGLIQQVPPMVSALKFQGQPLYKLARQGQKLDLPAREVMIYDFQYLDGSFGGENPWLDVEISCSKGTYIRSIAHDLGAILGVGGHLANLCRKQVGIFRLEEAWTIEELMAAAEAGREDFLYPMNAPLQHFPLVQVDDEDISIVLHGNDLFLPLSEEEYQICRIEDQRGNLLAMGSLKKLTKSSLLSMNKVLAGGL
ncbi:MAG: tRNA pseudouridine(55) synthase TruB [Clostridiales bacterium]